MKTMMTSLLAAVAATWLVVSAPVASAADRKPAPDAAAVVDALYRFAKGMDDDDPAMLSSAFTTDAEADSTPAAKRLGISFPLLQGREQILAALGPFAAPLVTSHSVANPRVEIRGRTARLHALVEAQHLPISDRSRHLLMKNRYVVELVRAGDRWLIRSMVIDNIWHNGDVSVLTGR